MLEKEPENALQPNLVTSTSVTSSTHMTSASEETTVQQADDDGSGVKKTVTVQQETTQKVMTSTSEQVPKTQVIGVKDFISAHIASEMKWIGGLCWVSDEHLRCEMRSENRSRPENSAARA